MISKEGERHSPFEEQFAVRDRSGILDISPEKVNGRPILFAPGWNAELESYRDTIKTIFTSGRRILSIQLSGTEDEKTDQLLSLTLGKGLNDIDTIAHSLGSPTILRAILGGKFRPNGAILINPAGMAGYSAVELFRHYRELVKDDGENTGTQDVGGQIGIREMARIVAKFDMYEAISDIEKMGIRVATIHTKGDKLSVWTDVKKEAERQGREGLHFMDGNHMDVRIPEALRLLEN